MDFNQSPENSQPIAQINMTPLVDVVLVLLVIFMLTVPMMLQTIQASAVKNDSQVEMSVSTQSLRIKADGTFELQGQSMSYAQLTRQLTELNQQEQLGQIHIHAEQSVSYQQLTQLMQQLQQLGTEQMQLIVDG